MNEKTFYRIRFDNEQESIDKKIKSLLFLLRGGYFGNCKKLIIDSLCSRPKSISEIKKEIKDYNYRTIWQHII